MGKFLSLFLTAGLLLFEVRRNLDVKVYLRKILGRTVDMDDENGLNKAN